MNGLFVSLEDEATFRDFVTRHYTSTPALIRDWMTCVNTVDEERITYAYKEYRQAVGRFSVLLRSKNPDHYKRAGALLHALNQSKPITAIDLQGGPTGSVDDLEAGMTRLSYGDEQHILKFVNFYEEYYNQLIAFDIAYRCCKSYENDPRKIDFDYLQNICRYLKMNQSLDVDSCFIIFKSIMV